ncbi:MAG: Rad52/Rad22 family DNA repair protein [Petrotogales bacterium]
MVEKKIEGMKIFTDWQEKEIQKKTPLDKVKKRKQGKGQLELCYVETSYIVSRLNEIFGFNWSWDILSESDVDTSLKIGEVMCEGKLTINGVSKTQHGSADVQYQRGSDHTPDNLISLGDNYKSASSDALKKCASLFGISLDVYAGKIKPEDVDNVEKPVGEKGTVHSSATRKDVPRNDPRSNQGLVTISTKQNKFMWYLVKTAGIPNKEFEYFVKVKFGTEDPKMYHSYDDFQEVIDLLKGLADKKKAGGDAISDWKSFYNSAVEDESGKEEDKPAKKPGRKPKEDDSLPEAIPGEEPVE